VDHIEAEFPSLVSRVLKKLTQHIYSAEFINFICDIYKKLFASSIVIKINICGYITNLYKTLQKGLINVVCY
jgi:hypothetical protein